MLAYPSKPAEIAEASKAKPLPFLIVAADDLTGACDALAPFAQAGRGARVLLQEEWAAEEVWAVSTNTRGSTAEAACSRFRAQIGALRMEAIDQVWPFLKVDSAGRGPIGASVLAAMDIYRSDAVVFAPAFPLLQRVVEGGVLSVQDIAGQKTTHGLRNLFSEAAQSRIVQLPISSLDELSSRMEYASDHGYDLWLCDSFAEEHLDNLVRAASRLSKRILWTGSAGLAGAIARVADIPSSAALRCKRLSGKAALVVSGSTHAVTGLQLQVLRGCRTTHIAEVKCDSAPGAAIRAQLLALRPTALILTGGDTAAMVLDALEARSILVGGEVEAGIAWGVISGGLADGSLVVTKSGGFGDHNALVKAVDFCTEGDA